MTSLTLKTSLTTALIGLLLGLLASCDMADRHEHYRSPGGSGGESGLGGFGGSGGTMDSGSLDGSDDNDSGWVDSGMADTGIDANVPTTPPFTPEAFFNATGQCALGHYVEFQTRATLLVEATQVYADDRSSEHLNSARTAFRNAMAAWQRAEVFSFGPAAKVNTAAGQDLRNQIYFFPIVNRCLIDQQLVNQRYAQTTFSTAQGSSRGLSAVEYLLFYEGRENSCGSMTSINAGGTWNALADDELAQRRADYAHATASNILLHATALTQAWQPSDGNFLAQLTDIGAGKTYETQQEVLDAMILAAFYLDKEIKDSKLAAPLSIAVGGVIACTRAPSTCPEFLESRFAAISTDNIRQNLVGFRQLFQGCGSRNSGLGIDDWLHSIDQDDLSMRILAALDHADDVVTNMNPRLDQAVTASTPASALELHAAIKAITDLFKTDLLMVLNVRLPIDAGGDLD